MESPQGRSESRPKRREWTEAQAREVLAQWKASKLSGQAFAAQQGIRPDRLYRWQRKLNAAEGSGGKAHGPAVVPLVALGVHARTEVVSAPGFEVQLGPARVLRIPAAFDAAALERLLRVLGGAGC